MLAHFYSLRKKKISHTAYNYKIKKKKSHLQKELLLLIHHHFTSSVASQADFQKYMESLGTRVCLCSGKQKLQTCLQIWRLKKMKLAVPFHSEKGRA